MRISITCILIILEQCWGAGGPASTRAQRCSIYNLWSWCKKSVVSSC